MFKYYLLTNDLPVSRRQFCPRILVYLCYIHSKEYPSSTKQIGSSQRQNNWRLLLLWSAFTIFKAYRTGLVDPVSV